MNRRFFISGLVGLLLGCHTYVGQITNLEYFQRTLTSLEIGRWYSVVHVFNGTTDWIYIDGERNEES